MKKSTQWWSIVIPALFVVFVVFALVYPRIVFAGASPQNANINVTATVIKSCSVTNSPAIAFGNYDATAAAPLQNAAGSINLQCTNGVTATISLNSGLYGAIPPPAGVTRAMKAAGSASYLGYDIFIPGGTFAGGYSAAYVTVWGDGAVHNLVSTSTLGSVGAYGGGALVTKNITLSGQIPASQNLPNDSYSDTVQATITF